MIKTGKIRLSLLFSIFIFFGIAHTVIDPLIPLFSQRLGIGYDRIGLILFASSAFSLFSTFASGILSDRYSLKRIILAGLIMVLAGFLIYGVYFSLAVMIITVVLFRVGCGILDSSIHAYVAKLFVRQHSPIFIRLDFYWYIGAIIGPLVVGILLFFNADPGYSFLFFAAAVLLITVLFYRYCDDINAACETRDVPARNTFISDYIIIVKNPVIVLACAALFFYIGIFSILSTWLTTYFADLGVPLSFGSIILSAFWAFNALGVFVTGKIIHRTDEINLLLVCSGTGCLSAIIYSLVPVITVKIIFLIIQAIFYASIFPLLNAVSVHEDVKKSGTILGLTLSVCIVGLIVFQPLSGFIMEYYGRQGINYLLISTALANFTALLLLFKFKGRNAYKNGDVYKNN
ncbi:MAG: MFS transporter [Actinobacteria bacterium]|nr:MFS transporter [Actinomycetota bacterium]